MSVRFLRAAAAVFLVACMFVLLLSACTVGEEDTLPSQPEQETPMVPPESTSTPTTTATAAPEAKATPTATPPQPPEPSQPATVQALPPPGRAALADLAARLEISPSQVEVAMIEDVTWENSCLGLPAPEMCAPGPTAGYRITFRALDQTYTYHTNLEDSWRYAGPGDVPTAPS